MTVAVLGEALIDLVEIGDGTFRAHLGGSPFNFAIGLARQGIATTYLSPLSEDDFGGRLREALRREGVQMPNARRSHWPTSLAIVTLDGDGNPAYRLYRARIADKDTTFEEIEAHLPPDLSLFHTGSLAITPSQLPKVRQLLLLLRGRGVRISIDLNIRLRASADTNAYLDGVRSLFPLADIVKASDDDLAAFSFDSDPGRNAQTVRREMGDGLFVLTRGGRGAELHTAAWSIEREAFAVAGVGDTIGAGDAFHAALIAALMRSGAIGVPPGLIDRSALGHALDFACAAAAINVTRAGCSPPTRQEVESFLGSA